MYLFAWASSALTIHSLPCPVIFDASLNGVDALQIHDTEEEYSVTGEVQLQSNDGYRPSARTIECPPLSQWESLTARGVPQKIHLAPKPVANKVATAHSTLELTQFQRFIRRMESAGPRIVLDRLEEDWQESPEGDLDEQVCS